MAHFLTSHKKKETEIIAYLDTTLSEKKMIAGIPVIGINELSNYVYDYIVVAFSNVKLGFDILINKGGGTTGKDSWIFIQ